jgi:hypothetical protein
LALGGIDESNPCAGDGGMKGIEDDTAESGGAHLRERRNGEQKE